MNFRTIGLWVVLIVLFVAFYQVFQAPPDESVEISFTTFLDEVREGKVSQVRVRGTRYFGVNAATEQQFRSNGPPLDSALVARLDDAGVDVSVAPNEEGSLLGVILSQWLPVVFLFFFFIFFMRQLQGKTSRLTEKKVEPQSLTAPGPLRGLDEERAMLRAAAEGIKNRTPGPRRVLISGPPGTGKTSLLRAAAADSGLKALVVAGSEFVEIFLGGGAKRVRDLFEAAKKQQPVMVVIEDLDAIAKARVQPVPERAHDERDQTLLELCQWLDGLKKLPERVLLVATTNRVDLLDPAITRPGRFDLHLKLEGDGPAPA